MRRCLTRPTQTVDTQGDVWILRVMCGSSVSPMRRCLTGPTQTVDTQGDVWKNTQGDVSPMRRCLTGPTQTVDTQGDVWNHCVTNEEVFNMANTNSEYSG